LFRAAILGGILFLGLPTLAFADDRCVNATDQSTMTACAAAAFKTADKQLNDVYRQIGERLADDADTRNLLADAQRAWIKFRDTECDFQSSATAGGSARPMIVAMCLDGLTQVMVRDLRKYLNCEEGAMDCPVPPAK
jgi:uncharacterized protein YecT (DUF1311 family)